jgi:hypothetical protein
MNNSSGYYIGDPVTGTFEVSVAAIAGAYRPSLTNIDLRLIGKRSQSDPDERALFDSERVLNPLCTVEIEANDGIILLGKFTLAGAATAGLGTHKAPPTTPASTAPTVPVYWALTALYTGATARKVLGTGVFNFRRDRVEDAV